MVSTTWRQHDQIKRPRDHIVEKFLGTSLAGDRKLYFEASPMSCAQMGQSRTLFILAYGLQDDIVDPISQSNAFLLALSRPCSAADPVVRCIAFVDV